MNEDKIIALLNNLDDDLIEKEIDNLMNGVECDMESIKRKAHQKLEKHNQKNKRRKRLPYVAAVLACFLCINTVYADEISTVVKSFFNKTPVYSTMVDGQAYYLKDRLQLDDNLTIDSLMVSEGRLDMECTSKLDIEVLAGMKIVPNDDPKTQYVIGGMDGDSEESNEYTFIFINGKEQNYKIKPFKAFDLIVAGKTYSVTLDAAKSLDGTQKLAVSEAMSNKIDLVDVGANSIEKNGKQVVQLIAAFKDEDMKLELFGQPVSKTANKTYENRKDGIVSHGTSCQTKDLYATDKNGTKYQLKVPADAKAWPITTFETDASKDSQLTIKMPALLANYQKTVDNIKIDIPKDGEKILNRDVDLLAQKAVVKSIQRLSPTTAKLVFQLNTGADKNVQVRFFNAYDKNIKKMSSEFNGDTAVMIFDFDQNMITTDLQISWPEFVINGNWTINTK